MMKELKICHYINLMSVVHLSECPIFVNEPLKLKGVCSYLGILFSNILLQYLQVRDTTLSIPGGGECIPGN